MEAAGINWVLFVAQLFNFALLIGWIILAVFALMRLRRAGLSQGVTLGWAALIILVPLLGAGAFLITRRNRRA
jgi:uncharacterized membrane protein YhaH (DUF805 family)